MYSAASIYRKQVNKKKDNISFSTMAGKVACVAAGFFFWGGGWKSKQRSSSDRTGRHIGRASEKKLGREKIQILLFTQKPAATQATGKVKIMNNSTTATTYMRRTCAC